MKVKVITVVIMSNLKFDRNLSTQLSALVLAGFDSSADPPSPVVRGYPYLTSYCYWSHVKLDLLMMNLC